MKIARIGIAFCLLLGAACKKDALPAGMDRARCEKMRNELAPALGSEPARINATFEPFAAPGAPTAPAIVVPWGGGHLALPARAYQVKLRANGTRFGVTLVLPEKKGVVILGRMTGDEPMTDVFAMVGEKAPKSAERVAFTTTLFGKAPTSYDLLTASYEVAAKDLDCGGDLKKAIRNAILLTLKSIGGPAERGAQVHRGVGFPDSVLKVAERGKGRSLEYDFRVDARAHTLTAFSLDPAFHDELLRLVPKAGAQPPTGLTQQQLPDMDSKLLALAGAPTPAAAQAMLKAAQDDASRGELVSELERYLASCR